MKAHSIKVVMASVALSAAMTGCIENDIPYPRIHANFLTIEAKGEIRPAQIDTATFSVTLFLPEDADIYSVDIESYTLTPKASVSSGDLSRPVDLSAPYHVTLSLYQDYEWTISGRQDIERYFVVENQVGTSVIDPETRTVTATVTKKTSLQAVLVERCKLAPSSAVVTPDLAGERVDFTSPVTITADNYGHTEEWTITVTQAESTVETVSVDAWTCVAWVYCEAEAGRDNTVQYRIKGDTGWLSVPQAWITADGGSYRCRLTGLTPETTYETRAVSGDVHGEALEFTTGSVAQMPNSDFDQWWLDGKVWNPWEEGGQQYWDTGNRGASTLGQSNTVPTDDTVDGSGRAAMLQTKFVGIGSLGKLAAGNIFTGRYVRTDGTNGVLSFGREFTQRPTALKGYMKYKTAPISSVTVGYEDLKGRPDTCIVWMALIDTPEPFEVRTNPKNQQLFDPAAGYVVAYGKMEWGYDVDAYIPFTVTLDYRSTSRVPKYIIVTASASKYGDYFTGGNGAVMCVDDFQLIYDYD